MGQSSIVTMAQNPETGLIKVDNLLIQKLCSATPMRHSACSCLEGREDDAGLGASAVEGAAPQACLISLRAA